MGCNKLKSVELQVPVSLPSIPVPQKSISQSAKKNRKMTKRKIVKSDDWPGAPHLPKDLVDPLILHCELWMACGHEIDSIEFIGRLANALVKKYQESKGETPSSSIPDRFGGRFCDKYPELGERFDATHEAREEDCGKDWQSQLRAILPIYDLTPECTFGAMELGFILKQTQKSKAKTKPRPRAPTRKFREIASTIVLTSMNGKFFPFHAVIKKEKEDPQVHRNISGVKIATNDSGWATELDWYNWLTNEFEDHTRKFKTHDDQWRFLLVDTFLSPTSIEERFFVECFSRKILCVTTPRRKARPPLPDNLDPFKCGTFGSLNKAYTTFIRRVSGTIPPGEQVIISCDQIATFFALTSLDEEQLQERRAETLRAWQGSLIFDILGGRANPNSKTNSRPSVTLTTPGRSDDRSSREESMVDSEIEEMMANLYHQASDSIDRSDYCISSPSRLLELHAESSETMPSSPSHGRKRKRPARPTGSQATTSTEVVRQLENQIQVAAQLDEDYSSDTTLSTSSLPEFSSPAQRNNFNSEPSSSRQLVPSSPSSEGTRKLARKNFDDALTIFEHVKTPKSKRICKRHVHKCYKMYMSVNQPKFDGA